MKILRFLLVTALLPFYAFAADSVLVDRSHPGAWQSDGSWTTAVESDGVDIQRKGWRTGRSESWITLKKPLQRGQTIEVTYRITPRNRKVDLFLGEKVEKKKDGRKNPTPIEVMSLGNSEATGWQTRRLTLTSNGTFNILGLRTRGWRGLNYGASIRIASIKTLPGTQQLDWHVWRIPPHQNPKQIPKRSPLQDFFPIGVYLPMEFAANFKHEGLKGEWEWVDTILADIKRRGMNFTSVANLHESDLDRLVKLHRKHGLRMNPQVSEFNIRWQGERALEPFTKAVKNYQNDPVIAGWAVGEEFKPKEIPQLVRPHQIVHELDPNNTLVTIQHLTENFKRSGEILDIRILMRDIYPFFAWAKAGPTTFQESLHFFESELNNAQTLLPVGASLWVMPQGQKEFYEADGEFRLVFRLPTPAEIKLQSWIALGLGAKGLAYFLYPSSPPIKPGLQGHFRGLRTYDGKSTPQLEALTALAKRLVPLGSTITKWERTPWAAATDHPDVRAYLFRGEKNQPYAVVYNRNVEQTTTAQIRIPFLASSATSLPTGKRQNSKPDNGGAIVSVTLPPGDGTILKLSGKLPPSNERKGIPRPDLPLVQLQDGRRLFQYNVDLQKSRGVPPGDSTSSDVTFKDWNQLGRNQMNGVFGREVTFRFTMPGDIASLQASAVFANHAHGKALPYRIRYSLDGKHFKSLREVRAGATAALKVEGRTQLNGSREVFASFELPERNQGIVLKELAVQLILAAE